MQVQVVQRVDGDHQIEVQFNYDGGDIGLGAQVILLEDGQAIGSGRVERTMTRFYTIDAQFDVGQDTGSPVTETYEVPFPFEGLRKLEVNLQ